MKISTPILVVILALMSPIAVKAAGLAPWQFGMTKEQVKSFRQFGPYKTFSNGDLETFSGMYHGRKENVQFFFANNRLQRIGIYLYEGHSDLKKTIRPFRRAYDLLQMEYGTVLVPELKVERGSTPTPSDIIAIAAAAHADIIGQTQIVPVKQPREMRVSARLWSGHVQGKKWYYVAVFLDQR